MPETLRPAFTGSIQKGTGKRFRHCATPVMAMRWIALVRVRRPPQST
ncbi:hypothetical protein AB3H13_27430 [Escherichia coli]